MCADLRRIALRTPGSSINFKPEICVMRHSEQLSITIPKQLLEELTEEIAVKVAARLKAKMHQVTSAAPVPGEFQFQAATGN
jgi:hypothetical protein